MTAPLIFLDIDGVCVTEDSIRSASWGKCADRKCVLRLNDLVRRTLADVVISSSWRIAHTLEFIRGTLSGNGFAYPDKIIGSTEHMSYRTESGIVVARAERRDEIRAWLSADPRDRFVILDDDLDAEIEGHYVRTSMTTGLTDAHVAEAVRILGEAP